jgi:hypothetical protein
MAEYSKSSPYYSTGKFGSFLDILEYRPIPRADDDVEYTIDSVYKYRPDMLAFDLYGNSQLWWVFASRNPNTIKDPIFDFVPGVIIYIPTQEALTASLGL